MSASSARASQNTVPAMIAMCRPEIERMWVRPESRMDSVTFSEMPPRSPVMSATAISPVSPGRAALMRALIARPQRIDTGPGGQVPRRRGRALEGRHLARGVAGCAEAVEPGIAREIEAAGLDRLGRRLERRSQRDGLADPRVCRICCGHADAYAVREFRRA